VQLDEKIPNINREKSPQENIFPKRGNNSDSWKGKNLYFQEGKS
jgi:hypothetical protein